MTKWEVTALDSQFMTLEDAEKRARKWLKGRPAGKSLEITEYREPTAEEFAERYDELTDRAIERIAARLICDFGRIEEGPKMEAFRAALRANFEANLTISEGHWVETGEVKVITRD